MRRAIRNVWRRVTFLVRRNQEAAALDEEMEFHLECRARDMRERGLPPDDAKRAARRAFGNRSGRCDCHCCY